MKFNILALYIFFLCCFQLVNTTNSCGQRNFKDKFIEGNLLMDDKHYELALKNVWLDLLQEEPDNANLNYKAGFCYFNTPDKKDEALPYFEKAINNTTKNYDELMPTEKRAPIIAYYYLARCYHINAQDTMQINKALENYNHFESTLKSKHYLIQDIQRQKEMCINAKELMNEYVQKDVKILNLGGNVNSKYPEHSPVISLDERAIYFTSKRMRKDSSNYGYVDENGNYFEDMYVSYKDDNNEWQEPELLNINVMRDNTATVSLSADGQTLYMYKDDGGNGNLYKSQLLGENWSEPEQLGSDINTDAFETHITVSPDNQSLYFVSDRAGGIGGKDIYRCKKMPFGDWSLAQNIGTVINTPYDEEGPFFHPDGKTMYFSSKGHKSMGGYDIFFSTLQEDDTWSEPRNIGYPINTTDDDVFYIESPDGKRAYYASGKNENGYGEKDIYMIELPKAMEKTTTILKGFVKVANDEKLPEDLMIVITDNETGEIIGGEFRPRNRDGGYVLPLQPGKSYNISYEAQGYEFYNTNIFVPFGSEYSEIEKAILLQPVNVGGSGEIEKPQWHLQFDKLTPEIAKGLKVSFYDDDGQMLFSEDIDEKGNFSYRKLPTDKNIIMKVNATDPSLCENIKNIALMDNEGNEVTKIFKDESCQFIYSTKSVQKMKSQPTSPQTIDKPSSEELASEKKWQIKFSKLSHNIPEGLTVTFVDENGNILYWEESDKEGYFDFHKLPSNSNISMKIDVKDATLCENIDKIVLLNDKSEVIIETKQGEQCVFAIKKQDSDKLSSSSSTISSTQVADANIDATNVAITGNPTVSGETSTIPNADATDAELNSSTTTTTSNPSLSGDNTAITKTTTPDNNVATTTTVDATHPSLKEEPTTISKVDAPDANLNVTSTTTNKVSYQEYFDYNIKTINQNAAEFKTLVENVIQTVNEQGVVNLSIESSASRVPTRTYKSNMELTKFRGNEAKELFIQLLQAKGIDKNKIHFVDVTTLVQGPTYQGDYMNKSKYQKYQYVKINLVR